MILSEIISVYFNLLQIIQVKNEIDLNYYLVAACLLILLLLSALASGSEAAFFSISPKQKHLIEQSKHYHDKLISKLIHEPKKLIGTILLFNNLVNISIVVLFTLSFNHYYRISNSPLLSFLFEVVFITLLLVIFGELFPKILATQKNYSFSKLVAIPISFLFKLFSPFTFLMISGTKIIDERIKRKNIGFSAEELRHAIELTGNKEQSAEEKNILKRIVTFGNVSVKQIMTPRMNVVAVEKNMDFLELLTEIKNNKFSRVPVYDLNPDNISGILYIKDLLPYLDKTAKFNWHKLIRPAYFVPETKKIDDLLHDFQTKKVHMAVVFDEFGGFSGIATLEDVLEEIVGEITDEFDETQLPFIRKIDENTFQLYASTSLTDTVKALNLEEDFFDTYSAEVESIGGLIVEILGNIPSTGQKVSFKNLEMTITASDEKKINEITIKIIQPEE
ncbi:MAG TPA: gliding motility-associated protein GldE [Bacteroidia bacterium]|nr:gliding motility-associated protein GldE [Sphingobacteriales bacterium]HPD64908.1 gliding motility-associated protein GldE [Bacteroidia bacterium]HRS58377.1 gliding motility-associated protein GldE [Bacteroidia bacterium]HRU67327.1 gliding motility-associated protein GldE [Bacteroidia bacterium]